MLSRHTFYKFAHRARNVLLDYVIRKTKSHMRFSKWCVYCYVCKYTSTNHLIEQCTTPGVDGALNGLTSLLDQFSRRGAWRGFRVVCTVIYQQSHKEDKEQRERWEEDNSQECQYPDVIVPAFWSMIGGQDALGWLYGWAERDGHDIRDDTESERQ